VEAGNVRGGVIFMVTGDSLPFDCCVRREGDGMEAAFEDSEANALTKQFEGE